MNFTIKNWVGVVSVALVCGASFAQADDWERGCGAQRALPQGEYRDLRRFGPDSYAPERFVSWAADRWVDQGGPTQYEINLQAYGSRYARDPYATDGGEFEDYQARRAGPDAESYPYGRHAPAYFREIQTGDYDQVYPVHGDARYGDEYEYISPDQFPGYTRDRRELPNKQAAYLDGRVYSSPQNAIVDKRSSMFYRGGSVPHGRK